MSPELFDAYTRYREASGGEPMNHAGMPFPHDPARNAFFAGAASMAEILMTKGLIADHLKESDYIHRTGSAPDAHLKRDETT
jgi:hypothetical protein